MIKGVTIEMGCIGDQGPQGPSARDEMKKAINEGEEMVTICIEETGKKLKVEKYRAAIIIVALEIFNILESRGIEYRDEIQKVISTLAALNFGY